MGVAGFTYEITQLFPIGLEDNGEEASGILSEVAAGGERILALAPNLQALVPMVARARMRCGDPEASKEYLMRVAAPQYVAPDPLDRNFLPAMVCAADLDCSENDMVAANAISPMLAPYEGWHAVAALGSAYLGPVSYWLGRLSLTRGRFEDALRQLERARDESERVGFVIYRGWSDYYLAQALPTSEGARRHGTCWNAPDTQQQATRLDGCWLCSAPSG